MTSPRDPKTAAHEIPVLVREARALAQTARFQHPCSDDVGRLLQVLAASVREGVVAEIGTGYGVGASWIASGLDPAVQFYTVELDAERAHAARRLLASRPNVHVIRGDWHEVLEYGPFALLFPDGGQAKLKEPQTVIKSVRSGGLIILDDMTPGEPIRGDPQREFWLNSPDVFSIELQLSRDEAAILAVRR
ncbi:MAG: O-methyltransferase [bacterium]